MSKFFKKFKKYSLSDWAKLYYNKGMCIIPLTPLTKIPAIKSWKDYQNERPTPKEIKEWFGGKNNSNIAIICGTISGNLVVIDFDREDLYNKFKDRLLKESIDLYNKFLQTWIVKTKKGYHVYFRIDIASEEFKKKVRTEHYGERTIDIQAEGAYVVAPPSIVKVEEGEEKGKEHQYYFLDGFNPDDEPTKLTWEEWEKIHNIIKDILKEIGAEEKNVQQNEQRTASVPTQTKQTEQQKIEKPVISSGRMRELSDKDLIEIKSLLIEAWKPGNRHDLALFLSGWFAKARIHPVNIANLLVMIVDEAKEKGFPDNELEDRLSTIYYSYSKALGEIDELKELDKYIEELKAKGKIQKNVSKRDSKETEAVKGKTGVQEILERAVGEEKALEIIRRISEILGVASPYKDSITIKTDFDSNLGYTNDMRRLRIYRCRIDEEEGIKVAKLVWEGAITKLTVIENPLGGITEYEVVWERQNKDKPLIVRGTLDDIYERLRSEGFLINTRLGKDALSSVVNGFINKNKAEVKRDIESPGFYLIDGQLTAIKYDVVDVSVDELKDALLFLNELATKWYPRTIAKFSTTIKWGIISPFIFARKQMGRQYQVPHLCLYGARDAGKSTLAEIATIHLWGLNSADTKYVIGGPQSNTEARLGERMRQSTFPVIINEANKMFENTGVVNMLKITVESTVARGRFTKNGYTDILALSPLILTLNPTPPVDFEGLMLVPKTLFLIDFSEGERLTREKIDEFSKDVVPRLETLRAIGQYVAKIVLNGGIELLKTPWQTLSEKLLERAYKDAGLEPPQWISMWFTTKSFEDVEEERLGRIRALMIDDINNRYAKYVQRMVVESPSGMQYPVKPDMISFEEKLNTLLRNNGIPYIIPKEGRILITSDIIYLLKLDVASLSDLADLLGWAHIKRSYRINGKVFTRYVIETTLEQLVNFLTQNEDKEETP